MVRFKIRTKMPRELRTYCVIILFFVAVDAKEVFVSRVSLDRRSPDSDISDIFNKTLASKDSSKFLRGARTPPTPVTRVMPSYAPPTRAFFTPPLPREYQHPFADKPTLRGSNSDGSSVASRRPVPPPPPFKYSPAEMIPIRPPDLAPHDTKKKTLNTPSFKKVAEPAYSETSSTTTSNTRVNETYDFVPIFPYPSVSRILSGGSGRKHDAFQDILERTRLEHEKDHIVIKPEVSKATLPIFREEDNVDQKPPMEPVIEEPNREEEIMSETHKEDEDDLRREKEEAQKQEVIVVEKNAENAPVGQDEEPKMHTRQILGIAWDIHVYLIATLFSILALCSLIIIIRVTYTKHLLSTGYFLSLHGILLIIGCMRSFFLFYDAYNVHGSFPEPVANVLLNMVFPLLTSAFAILFLFLMTAAEVKALNNKVQKASFLGVFIILHVGLSLSVHLYSGDSGYAMLLPLICQCVFIVMCVGLGLSYVYVYKSLSQCCAAKGYGGEWDRWGIGGAVRVTLATAMLSLLMAAVQLYGMLGVYQRGRPHPWLWWGLQLSVRVIEISQCALLGWAGAGRAPPPARPASVDDVYPAVCAQNQAYTLRKHRYDDTMFPLNSLPRLQPSPSMLVAENGFVRFRTMADPEPPSSDTDHYQTPTLPPTHQYA